MGRQDELKQVVSDLRFRSLSLLKAIEKLEQSFPTHPSRMNESSSWPAILGQYEVIAKQLRDLHDEIPLTELLQHRVPRPTESFADPNGAPSMFVPLALQTKLPPELERQQEHVNKLVKEEFQESISGSFKSSANVQHATPSGVDLDKLHDRLEDDHNNIIDEADIAFDDARRVLLKDCANTVERYSVNETQNLKAQVGKLIRFMETGDRTGM